MLFSTLNFMFLLVKHPFVSRFNNRIELFNEFCILMCSHTFLALLNTAMEDAKVHMTGWFFIGFASLNVVTNVGISTY